MPEADELFPRHHHRIRTEARRPSLERRPISRPQRNAGTRTNAQLLSGQHIDAQPVLQLASGAASRVDGQCPGLPKRGQRHRQRSWLIDRLLPGKSRELGIDL